MNQNMRRLLGYGLLAVLFLIGLAVASRYDLALSSALAGLSETGGSLSLDVPLYASVLEIIGEWPAVLICAAALFVAVSVLAENHPKRAVFFYIGAAGLSGCLFLYGTVQTAKHMFDSVSGGRMLVSVLLSAALTAACLLLVPRLPNKIRRTWFLPAVYTLAAAALIFLSVSALKVLWGRVRLRELIAAGSLDGFTPWYVPNFFSGSHSLPSGHTAHCTLILMLPLWLPEKSKRAQTVFTVICAVFIAVMGISRIAAGAHYLSDVLFGFGIAFVITQWMKHALDRARQTSPLR